MTALENLKAAAATFEERGKIYGNNYNMTGPIMQAFFPNGIELTTPEDHARFTIFNLIMVKMSRYAKAWEQGGHKDSAHDIIVYAAILEERTKL